MGHLARLALIALLAAGFALSIEGSRTAVAADRFRVVGVGGGEVLNIRSGPSASRDIVGTIPPGSTGVEGLGECVRGWCLIRFGPIEGWVNARFLAPEAGNTVVVEPERPPPSGSARRVLADGTMELRLADGSALRLTADGRDVRVAPDGTLRPLAFIQVPIAELPPLPPELNNWGTRVGDDLLGILRNILTTTEINAYLRTETGKSYYELVQWRLRSIAFLTRPAS